ncbi:MAG: bifunctional YncE family protein/alkaline phosphatase family protein [Planctomycetaceae bacterium]|nr:bifunctional YncE family protein/alkaline phosphatase family protein [Planctomycetaceae bacterium]
MSMTGERRRIGVVPALTLLMGWGVGVVGAAEPSKPEVTWPGMTRSGAVLLPNGWSLRPAGTQAGLGDFPVVMAVHPNEPVLAVLHAGYGEHEVVTLEAETGKVIGRVALPETFAGLAWSPDGTRLYAGGASDGVVYRFDHDGGLLSRNAAIPCHPPAAGESKRESCVSGIVVSGDGKTLWVADAFAHSVVRLEGLEATRAAQVTELPMGRGSYPYGLAWEEARRRLYVSLWNRAEVAVIDTEAKEVVGHWKAQEHPNEVLLARGGKVLYVANANRNTVSVIDTATGKAVEVIGTAIAPGAPSGCTPSSLALPPDASVLFVANANTNNVAVVNVKDLGGGTPLGFIPTGWYPTSVRVAHDGKRLYVANGKGATSKANREGPNPLVNPGDKTREYIAGLFRGTLSIIPMPDPKQMAAYSKTVYECCPLKRDDPTAVVGPARAPGNPIPAKVGDPSPITHCVYIIKENRTYDQILGDLPEGNGEPSLCLFPEEITPNHHALAREFVLLDNFYVDGEVSADGHEWSMGAYASDYVEKTWPLMYRGNKRVPYPSEGALAIARPAGGYLWDRAAEKGVSYRSYGEFIKNADRPGAPATTGVEALRGHFDPKFRSFDLDYPDVRRADRFLEELAGFERSGEMPRLVIMRLPNDHTAGTTPGKPTVTAYVADNDLALGRVVEGLTKSRFWKHLAIFVVEDDAQNGSDHVDAHRTVALVLSPYVRRKSVDSTMYSTSSMLRTIELCLGLEPMSQFDAAARPMANAFTAAPDLGSYTHRPARVDLNARNTATAWGAEASTRLNLEIEDRADDLIFNEIIWKAVKGADSPMPPPVRSAFILPRPRAGPIDD